jgi:hypothetical protein
MSAGDQDVATAPLSHERVLDELEFLAKVEHALVVECLSVCCALGHDLDAGEGGATTKHGRDAADAASALAQNEMFHLKEINLALLAAGRAALLERVPSISSASVATTPLGPPSFAELQQLPAREQAIASAVDERYTQLRPAVTSDPVFDGELLSQLRSVIVDHGPTHTAAFATILDPLTGLTPTAFLRATRREAADSFEGRLLEVSDRSYGLILKALAEQFAQAAAFSDLAVSAMEGLDEINRALVQRGLLPPFTSP